MKGIIFNVISFVSRKLTDFVVTAAKGGGEVFLRVLCDPRGGFFLTVLFADIYFAT
jgi:hypothetical protein